VNFRTTFKLFITACLLAYVVWLVTRHFETTDARRNKTAKVLCIADKDISYLMIKYNDVRISCVKKNGVWSLDWPVEAKADEGRIDRIISAIETMPREEVISAAQRKKRALSLNDYGLLQPRVQFSMGDKQSSKKILVGRDVPLGNMVYIKLSDSEEVIATPSDILSVIPKNVNELRDRIITHGDASHTARVEMQRPGMGFIQLTQTAGGWIIQQPAPVGMRADAGKITQMLDALYALKVEEFIWDPAMEPAVDKKIDTGVKVETYELTSDEATARITVWVDGDKVGKELILGKQLKESNKYIYAKRRDIKSIYSVKKDILDAFPVTVNDLRSKNIFSIDAADVKYVRLQEKDKTLVLERDNRGWIIANPVQWRADYETVSRTIQKITSLRAKSFAECFRADLAEFGLAEPAYIIQLLTECPDSLENKKEIKRQPHLLIGTLVKGKESVFAEVEGSSSVKEEGEKILLYELPYELTKNLCEHFADPLVYRNLTMLAVPSENITRISLLKNGREQTIFRNASGTWAVPASNADRVNQKTVQDMLFFVGNMRAQRVECHNPKKLTDYGLDHPGTIATFGLRGKEGIQKSVIIGAPFGTDGFYAMIQGQDVVFILDKVIVERLTGNLTDPIKTQK